MTVHHLGVFFRSVKGIQWRMINFWWIWVFLKENTAKDSIRKEQEIMQTPPNMENQERIWENSDPPKKSD